MCTMFDKITAARERMVERDLERSRAMMLARRRIEQAENEQQIAYFARFGITGDIVRRPELLRPSLELSVLTEAVYLSHYRNAVGDEVVDVRGAGRGSILGREGENDAVWSDMILDAVGKAAGL